MNSRHSVDKDDASFFRALTEKYRAVNHKTPVILMAYNYYRFAELLRFYGLNAFSMTIALSGGDLHGLVEDLPVKNESLAMYLLFQKTPYVALFRACEAVGLHGMILIEENNLPYLGEVVLNGLGFARSTAQWRGFSIYRKLERKDFTGDTLSGFEVFKTKQVLSPHLIHRRGVNHAERRAINKSA